MPTTKRSVLQNRRTGSRLWYGWVLACALSACSPIYCHTEHNMLLVTEPLSSGECARYNSIEIKLVEVLGNAERLNWMAVSTRPEVSFVDPLNRNVGGYTDCFAREMVVGAGATVFAHETVHALQNCNARQPAEDGWDYDHANWQKDGLFSLIERVSQ